MKPFIALLCSCPLLLSSGVAWSINQDILNIQSSIQTQEQINMLRQEKGALMTKSVPLLMSPNQISNMPGGEPQARPALPPGAGKIGSIPDTYEGLGPDRYTSPHGTVVDKQAKPKGPFGPVVVPPPFNPDKTQP